MRYFIKILFFIFIFSSFIYSQDPSRPQKIKEWQRVKFTKHSTDKVRDRYWKLVNEIVAPGEADIDSAKKINARAFRLFPDGIMDKLTEYYDSYGPSFYPFTEIADYPSAMLLEYKTGSLIFNDLNHLDYQGSIADMGQIPLETINEQNPEFIALTKYQPSSEEKDTKPEFSVNGLTFRKNALVKVEDTYLLKIISRGERVGIFALKIYYKDTDSSIVIFVKTIKTFAPPELPKTDAVKRPPPDPKSAEKITIALRKRGYKNVVVDSSTTPMTLSGTVPKGKMQDMVRTAQEAAGLPLLNRVTEK